MSKAYTKWTCSICSNPIAWDELFTYTSKKTVVHFDCMKRKAQENVGSSEALNLALEALEEELTSIVKYKSRINKVTDEELKKLLENAEKDAEKNAALLTRAVERLGKL
jgi:hypothetical protein